MCVLIKTVLKMSDISFLKSFVIKVKNKNNILDTSDQTAQLLNKPYVNEVILRRKILSLECCQPLELFRYIKRGFRSFHTGNISSVG